VARLRPAGRAVAILERVRTDNGGTAEDLPAGLAPARPGLDPPRWVAALALVGGLAVAVAPFADWVEVTPAEAVRHGKALREAADGAGPPSDPRLAAWAGLGARLAERHALSGVDVVRWSGAARAQIAEADRVGGEPSEGNAQRARGWSALAVAIVSSAAAGALLAVYLARHRLRRFRNPMRVLAGTTGMVAFALAVGLDWITRPTDGAAVPGVAQGALLGGGAGLVGAMAASLTLRSALPVLAGTALTVSALAAVAWMWVVHGPTV
jgi:hypothetical protein